MFPAKKDKTLNFGRPHLRGTPHFEPPIFVRFIFIYNIYPFRKFDTSASNDLKVQNFGGPVSGKSPTLVTISFVKFYLFLIFTYTENFVCLA